MDGSPNSQQSIRSRPNYPHPILLEDDRTRNADPALGSPTSVQSGSVPSDYDPEAPYPHTENSYAYNPPAQSITNQDGRIGSHQSSPTTEHYSHHYNPMQQRQQHSPTSNSSYASQQPTLRGPQSYYSGVIPFLGSPPPTQNIPMIPAPTGGYLCEQCSLTFTRAHDLRRHYTSKHAEIKCQCICGKNFSRKDALLRHQRPDPVSGYGGCEEAQAVTPHLDS